MNEGLIEFLSDFVTEQRFEKFCSVLDNRTRYISIILEDIYTSQNASAALRTCDCFGIQDVFIIENRNQFNVNPHVAKGSSNWLSIHKYNEKEFNTIDAIKDIKSRGFRVVATSQEKNSKNINDLNLEKGKVAFIFGNEHYGLSNEAKSLADEIITIPMFGFTESFNISVSASIIIYNVMSRLRNSEIPWNLTEEEKKEILVHWLKTSIKKSDLLLKKFNESFPKELP